MFIVVYIWAISVLETIAYITEKLMINITLRI